MDLVAYYDAYWSQADDNFDHDRLALLSDRIDEGETVVVVDGGPGVLARKIQDRGADVVLTDLSAVAVKRAQDKGIPSQQVDVDMEDLPFADASFDVVVSDSAIEHRFFSTRSFDECTRVMKPGGRFILCLPNMGHWKCRLWVLFGRFPYVQNSPTDFMHLRFFTVREAKALCRARGLKPLEVDGSPSLWSRDFYPQVFRKAGVREVYSWLVHRWPSIFARDFILVCRKESRL
jgi:SAM-dependent methyltransferase